MLAVRRVAIAGRYRYVLMAFTEVHGVDRNLKRAGKVILSHSGSSLVFTVLIVLLAAVFKL